MAASTAKLFVIERDAPFAERIDQLLSSTDARAFVVERFRWESFPVSNLDELRPDAIVLQLSSLDDEERELLAGLELEASRIALIGVASGAEVYNKSIDAGLHHCILESELSGPLLLRVVEGAVRASKGQVSTEFLSSILNTIADPIFVKDRRHHWIVLNDACCEFMGYPREELLGRSDYEFFPKEQADVFWEKDEVVFESGQTNENEESFTDSQGRVHTISTKKSLFVDSRGRKILVGIIRDMTERKELERDLIDARRTAEHAVRAKSSFLANTSHELRTPMNGIIGMTDILLSTALNSEQREAAEHIRDSSTQLLRIINGLLDFSKLEAGRVVLDTVPFDLRGVVSQVLTVVAPTAHRKSLSLASFVDRRVPRLLLGDPSRLREVLMNLIDNAVKFTNSGTVQLRVEAESLEAGSARVSFEIEDSGVGLTPNQLETIFEAFVQVPSEGSKSQTGTGLGLAIVKELIDLMNGEISVESEPSRGSLFRLSIPFRAPADQPAEPEMAGALAGLRALVVARAEGPRARLLSKTLTQWGVTPEIVPTSQALDLADERRAAGRPFDVCILNVSEASFVSLAKQLQARGERLLVCHRLGELPPDELIFHGPVALIVEPCPEHKLLGAIRALTSNEFPTSKALPYAPSEHRILVVEDNPVNQKVTSSLLARLGYQFHTVAGGVEAVDAVAASDYSAVLMDCRMPGVSGFETAKRIRELGGQAATVPIIAMTASASQEDELEARQSGMNDALSKPVTLDVLSAMLRRWTDRA